MSDIVSQEIFKILKKNILVDGFHVALDLEKSKGSYIVDALSGKKYLDCYTYFATLPIGHNHPKMFRKNFLADLQRAAIANPANSDMYCKELAWAIDIFGRLAKPKGFKHMFFVAGGSLAVENALKVAFDWKVQKNKQKGLKREKGSKVIHFREAFHGRSGYTLSLTNTDPGKTRYFPQFKWPRIDNPKLTFPLTPKVLSEVKKAEKNALDQIKKAIVSAGDDIAALIIEPIQGEGGDNHFRNEFLQALQKICNSNDILFIVDEVQTGFGSTGKLWAYQNYGITPDLIAFGKKAQVCGVIAGPRIQEVEDNVFKVSSRINSTWGGNLVDYVRGARYLEIMKEEQLVANCAKVGKYLLKKLEQELYDGERITNVRGKGLFIAFDLPSTEERDNLRQKAWDHGLASLACGTLSMRLRPPLTFSHKDADKVVAILQKCL